MAKPEVKEESPLAEGTRASARSPLEIKARAYQEIFEKITRSLDSEDARGQAARIKELEESFAVRLTEAIKAVPGKIKSMAEGAAGKIFDVVQRFNTDPKAAREDIREKFSRYIPFLKRKKNESRSA